MFLALLRVVNSPFGRVLQAIRENDFRAEALGYRTVIYRTIANCLGAVVATLAGALYALWLRYTGPDTTLSFGIMIDILLMVVIGGMGTMYGAVIGATILLLAESYLQNLMGVLSKATGRAAALAAAVLTPTAGCCGSASCSSSACISSRPASSAGCAIRMMPPITASQPMRVITTRQSAVHSLCVLTIARPAASASRPAR